MFDASLPRDCLAPLMNKGPAIATVAVEMLNEDDRTNPNMVKVVGTPTEVPRRLRALYFTRAPAPYGDGPLYHHQGIYAYRRSALERFVSLRPSTLEKREQLEQLRALEDGMRIDVSLVDSVPVEVNTPADLERARRIISGAGRA
jgi:3-deoxy-manno-octulosonate cytidylyltransferase (CMP-KDO synthetase)